MVGGSDPIPTNKFDAIPAPNTWPTHPAPTNKEEGSDPLSLYEHDIRRFVDAMKYKLRKNAHKGRWETYDQNTAQQLLLDEVEELAEAIKEGNMVEIMLEAADVANFAMMIAVMSMERK